VINIKPGLVDTDVVKKFTAKKSESTDVADVVWYAITSPVRIYDIHFGPK
jgi:NADP-dependent 3-hydroxy acid dehydrogenase YdfG